MKNLRIFWKIFNKLPRSCRRSIQERKRRLKWKRKSNFSRKIVLMGLIMIIKNRIKKKKLKYNKPKILKKLKNNKTKILKIVKNNKLKIKNWLRNKIKKSQTFNLTLKNSKNNKKNTKKWLMIYLINSRKYKKFRVNMKKKLKKSRLWRMEWRRFKGWILKIIINPWIVLRNYKICQN